VIPMTSIPAKTIFLASSSPRRRELMSSLPLQVSVHPSETDEHYDARLSPDHIVETLALRKAMSVAKQLLHTQTEGIVVGSDTIVVLDGRPLGKPTDRMDAFRMLKSLQGREHLVYTGVACVELPGEKHLVRHRVTKVHMKSMSARQIDSYIATGEPMDKAGSYAIQGIGATLIDRIEGDYFNVVGLPLSLLSDMLEEFGVHIL
jgi:MAF protein